MRALSQELSNAAWTLGAIGAVVESGLIEHLREPRSADELSALCRHLTASRIERLLSVAAAAGVVVAENGQYRLAPGAMPFVQPPMREVLRGDIRSNLMQVLAFLDASGDAPAPQLTNAIASSNSSKP